MKVAMFPLNGPPAASMVPPEFLELAEKAFGADINNVNNDGGDSSGASEQKMEKGDLIFTVFYYSVATGVVPDCFQ